MIGIITVFLCVLAIPLSVGFVSYMINRVEYNAQLDIAYAHNMPCDKLPALKGGASR